MRGRWVVGVLFGFLGLSGCFGSSPVETASDDRVEPLDLPLDKVDDVWYEADGVPNYWHHTATAIDAPFHSLDELAAKLEAWAQEFPDLVRVDVIGESIQGRPIWDVVVTNKSVPGPKLTPLIDGGHHANELGGTELALFVVDFLLQNYATNASARALVDQYEIHVVPLVNPDGYVVQTRGNALGVNLNRNYDIDWGNPAGASNLVMGTLAHATGQPMPSVTIVAENCGSGPFSEPESRAMRDLMQRLAPTAAFYLTGHTPTHAVIAPWAAYDPPFPVEEKHQDVLEAELEWIRTQTEYEAGKAEWGNFSAGLPYSASGSSMDYFYVITKKPAFTVEVEIWYTSSTSDGYPQRALADYEGLRYWMDVTLPIPMHLLANTAELAAWQVPDPAADPATARRAAHDLDGLYRTDLRRSLEL